MNIWEEIGKRMESESRHDAAMTGYPRVNAHIHTPYSFSSFASIDDIITKAREEGLTVLGINDFNTLDGYDEWAHKCFKAAIFPLFNLEMTGLSMTDMEEGRKINDPNNPGRIYISGKALAYPLKISKEGINRLLMIRDRSNEHVRLMTMKVNDILERIAPGLKIDFDEMLSDHTRGMARERHLAFMIRKTIEGAFRNDKERDDIFCQLTGISFHELLAGDKAGLENLIRSRILKAGGPAFVEEDPDIFIDPGEIRRIILGAGGLPTYPFLADYDGGSYTDFERDPEKAANELWDHGFYSVEFIPSRNNFDRLKDYVMFLHERDFIITFGTEHNAPGVKPLEVKAKGGKALDDDMMRINYEGACLMAAHQYQLATGGPGYLDDRGLPRRSDRDSLTEMGKRLIETVIYPEL